jgi:integrase
MPVSLLRHIPLQVGAVMNRNPNSVLDVGCGFGIYGALLREYLDVWCAPCEYGEHRTASSSGTPLRPSTTSGWFRNVVADTGLQGVRFHDLRQLHATFLLKAGTPPHVVSRRLGHSTVAFTLQVYAHVLPGQQREAADAIEATLLGNVAAT